MQTGPWQTLASELKYDNPWIRVTEHQVINPKGGRGIYGVVHLKHIALGIVPLDDEGNTWLVGQHRYPLDAYSWEIPEGGGHLDLDPLASAQRELREETGIEADHWQKVLDLHLSNSVTDEGGHVYVATGLHFGAAEPEDTEELALRKLPLAEAYRMVVAGEITDCVSVAALLRVWLMQREADA
jgi:8-oxo-dGTP pyrophosphatase MutT (NUDIX family)